MATPIQKSISQSFATNVTGSGNNQWNLTVGSGYVQGAWFLRHPARQTSERNSGLSAAYMGCLRATVRKGNPSNVESYWEYTGSWEDLGVPKGSVVNSITANFKYRWQCQTNSNHKATDNLADFSGLNAGVGPMTIRDSGGTSLGTISSRQFAIDRTPSEGIQWKCYPDGDNDGSIISQNSSTGGWFTSTGSPVTIVHPNALSNKTIKLRIGLLHPSLTDPGMGLHSWLRTKIDQVDITIQHSQGTAFFSF